MIAPNLRSQAFREEVGAIRVREDRVSTKEIPQYWTDNPVLQDLKSRSNQLIVGRRGVGKTTLLKKLALDLQAELIDRKVLPLYIDCNTLRFAAEDPVETADDASRRARAVFIQCALTITTELASFASQLSATTGTHPVTAFFESILKNRKNDISKTLQTILDDVNGGVLVVEPEGTEVSQTMDRAREESLAATAGVGIDATGVKAGASISAGASSTVKTHSREQVRGTRRTSPKPLLDGLLRIISETDLEAIYIILDDITRISRFSDVQPHFFEFLKNLIPSNTDAICIKIGAVSQELQMSHGALGLSPADDVHQIDLDLRAANLRSNSSQTLDAYLQELLYRHLLYRIPNFRLAATGSADADDAGRVPFNAAAWKVLFADPDKCLREIVAAAGGNPRDLLATFVYAFDHFLTRSKGGLIEHADIVEGSRFHYLRNKSSEAKQHQFLTAILTSIKDQFIRRTRHPTKVFCLPEGELRKEECAWALRELERFRIINRMGTWEGPTEAYEVFEICTGLVIDAIVRTPPADEQDISRSRKEYEEFCRSARDSVVASILAAQVLQVPPAGASITPGTSRQMVLCMACGHRFAPSHKGYQKHGDCPQCGEPILR